MLVLLAEFNQPILHSEWAIEARNHYFFKFEEFLTKTFPENTFQILLLSLTQIFIAAGIGLWIGNGIDKPGHLIPVCIVAGLADTWSVSAGATSLIIRSPIIHHFLLRFPLIGSTTAEYPFLIGLTDFLFFGLFYRASVRFSLGEKKNIFLLALSFVIAITAAIFCGIGIPVLPFSAGLFLIANWTNLNLKKEEILQICLFLLMAGLSAFIFTKLFVN
ncbi:MAG: hypothetical protein HQM08_20485 [Candidatus Riflebacteria bacterium]|nr:hypothetical protein [Candidatus Riflebacteria bacterium]